MNEYRNIDNKVLRNVNTKTNTSNGNKNKKNIRYKKGKPYNGTVGGIPKWKLEPKGYNNGNTMVRNGKTYYWFTNNHNGGMWVFKNPRTETKRKVRLRPTLIKKRRTMERILTYNNKQ